MTQFSIELDLVNREIERLTAEVNQLRIEYDLDDGVNDDAEQAEIDALEIAIRDLQERQERLRAETECMMPLVDDTPIIELEPINITGSPQISYYEDELKQFMGTRLGGWASRCSQAILGARTELNVQIPDDGFDVTSVVEVLTLIPGAGQFFDAGKKIYGLLEAVVRATNVRPGTSFADVGHDLSNAFIDFQGQMERDSTERNEIYDLWVSAYRQGDPDDQVPRDLIRSEIESWVSGMVTPNIIARRFLLKCFECLDDPAIELLDPNWHIDPFSEAEGYETGDVSLRIVYRSGRWSLSSAYVDDAPQALVDALRRNFGASTRCIDLPLAMRCQIVVYYRDRGDQDEDDSTWDTVDTYFLARRRSREPGNQSFSYSLASDWNRYENAAKEEAVQAWETERPYLTVTLGQLGGD